MKPAQKQTLFNYIGSNTLILAITKPGLDQGRLALFLGLDVLTVLESKVPVMLDVHLSDVTVTSGLTTCQMLPLSWGVSGTAKHPSQNETDIRKVTRQSAAGVALFKSLWHLPARNICVHRSVPNSDSQSCWLVSVFDGPPCLLCKLRGIV